MKKLKIFHSPLLFFLSLFLVRKDEDDEDIVADNVEDKNVEKI